MEDPVRLGSDRGDKQPRLPARGLDGEVPGVFLRIWGEAAPRPVLNGPGKVDLQCVLGLGRNNEGARLFGLRGKL